MAFHIYFVFKLKKSLLNDKQKVHTGQKPRKFSLCTLYRKFLVFIQTRTPENLEVSPHLVSENIRKFLQ
uniref:Uncharacterized protein n=1 Tax=Anguilla anguilla TaxID=7936 RepID=A0A0E9PEV7_ANGAN